MQICEKVKQFGDIFSCFEIFLTQLGLLRSLIWTKPDFYGLLIKHFFYSL